MADNRPATTAEAMASYYHELSSRKVPEPLIDELVKIAASKVESGLQFYRNLPQEAATV